MNKETEKLIKKAIKCQEVVFNHIEGAANTEINDYKQDASIQSNKQNQDRIRLAEKLRGINWIIGDVLGSLDSTITK